MIVDGPSMVVPSEHLVDSSFATSLRADEHRLVRKQNRFQNLLMDGKLSPNDVRRLLNEFSEEQLEWILGLLERA